MDTNALIGPLLSLALAVSAGAIAYGSVTAKVESNESSIDFLVGRLDRSDDQLIARIERLEERVCRP